jgi:hypothetical protein
MTEQTRDYELGLDELNEFIKSSKDRNLHYFNICLTGGEVSLWKHLEEGVQLLRESGICDQLMLITNGNNPERIINISQMLDYWIVSSNLATDEQVRKYLPFSAQIQWNNTKHQKFPEKPLPWLLPAVCCCTQDLLPSGFLGLEYNGLLYFNKNVYYCDLAYALKKYAGSEYDDLVCSFADDFISKFKDKQYDKAICSYCLCNRKIWNELVTLGRNSL